MNYIRQECLTGAALDEWLCKMNMIQVHQKEMAYYLNRDKVESEKKKRR
jgi:hypothetical protein